MKTTEYLSAAETAKLVRKALSEAFPGVKFSVRSKSYSGGASINVGWIDGPNSKQVEAVAKRFEGSHFDSMIDLKSSLSTTFEGRPVHFAADYVFCNREFSDALVGKVIASTASLYGVETVPTVADWKQGRLYGANLGGSWDFGRDLWIALAKRSDRLAVRTSPTASAACIAA
jgi:hypothetical protein